MKKYTLQNIQKITDCIETRNALAKSSFRVWAASDEDGDYICLPVGENPGEGWYPILTALGWEESDDQESTYHWVENQLAKNRTESDENFKHKKEKLLSDYRLIEKSQKILAETIDVSIYYQASVEYIYRQTKDLIRENLIQIEINNGHEKRKAIHVVNGYLS